MTVRSLQVAAVQSECRPRCAVIGCRDLAVRGPYCIACDQEIHAYESWKAAREWRRAERRGSGSQLARAAVAALEPLVLVFFLGCLAYVGWKFGAMFIVWALGGN
ncbi:MAG TPA: hypothetical protein VGR47_05830 [Terracidiphilus sp.]|nr:hypothetical protein [Terracidiphilus sp.]